MMDSIPIEEFLESTYPDPPVPLTSELGREIVAKARATVGNAFRTSVMPREVNILSPRAQEYFRRTREASLGHPLEDLLESDKEEQAWNAVGDGLRVVGELMLTHKADGPFVLGAQPSGTDFFIAGSLQCARMVDEGVFQRIIKYPGFEDIYKACLPYMERKD
jgi:glutathione S-transferase